MRYVGNIGGDTFDSVEKIGIRAFEQCPKLEKVNLPDKVLEVGAMAFNETPWLEAQRGSDKLAVVNGMLLDAEGAEGDIVVPSSVKFIWQALSREMTSSHPWSCLRG